MILSYDDRAHVWVATGTYLGRKFVAEGSTLADAWNEGIHAMNEIHRRAA